MEARRRLDVHRWIWSASRSLQNPCGPSLSMRSIRHIRLWDDTIRPKYRWRGPYPQYTEPKEQKEADNRHVCHPLDLTLSGKWYEAETLLAMIFGPSSGTHPTLDLSIGIANIGSCQLTFIKCGRALSAIHSLRVLVDYSADMNSESRRVEHLEFAQWGALKGLIRDINSAKQVYASSAHLQLFYIEDCGIEFNARHRMPPWIWQGLLNELRPTVRALRLHFSSENVRKAIDLSDPATGGPLTGTWPQLRQLTIVSPRYIGDFTSDFHELAVSFLRRHPLLDDLDFCEETWSHPEQLRSFFRQTFSDIQSLSVTTIPMPIAVDVLGRHANLRELRVRDVYITEEDADGMPLLPNLRVLRAPCSLIKALITAGSRPTQLETTGEEDVYEVLDLLQWFSPGSSAAQAITCLSIQWRFVGALLQKLVPRLGHLVSSLRFPALCELVISSIDVEGFDEYPTFDD
ncbi:hypothetical protein V8E36_009857 [Tilletia maclaganii]